MTWDTFKKTIAFLFSILARDGRKGSVLLNTRSYISIPMFFALDAQ